MPLFEIRTRRVDEFVYLLYVPFREQASGTVQEELKIRRGGREHLKLDGGVAGHEELLSMRELSEEDTALIASREQEAELGIAAAEERRLEEAEEQRQKRIEARWVPDAGDACFYTYADRKNSVNKTVHVECTWVSGTKAEIRWATPAKKVTQTRRWDPKTKMVPTHSLVRAPDYSQEQRDAMLEAFTKPEGPIKELGMPTAHKIMEPKALVRSPSAIEAAIARAKLPPAPLVPAPGFPVDDDEELLDKVHSPAQGPVPAPAVPEKKVGRPRKVRPAEALGLPVRMPPGHRPGALKSDTLPNIGDEVWYYFSRPGQIVRQWVRAIVTEIFPRARIVRVCWVEDAVRVKEGMLLREQDAHLIGKQSGRLLPTSAGDPAFTPEQYKAIMDTVASERARKIALLNPHLEVPHANTNDLSPPAQFDSSPSASSGS
jgi:hypothetical protein